MDMQAASYGANKAIEQLVQAGQVGQEQTGSISLVTGENTGVVPVKELVGLKMKATFPGSGISILTEPKTEAHKDEDFLVNFTAGEKKWYVRNSDLDGALSKKCLGIGGDFSDSCPTFAVNYPGYNLLTYFYEETKDNLGLGLTAPKGWYATNLQTFAFTPFDFDRNPFVTADIGGATTFLDYQVDDMEKFKDFLDLKKTVSFTVAESSLLDVGAIGTLVFCGYAPAIDPSDVSNISATLLTGVCVAKTSGNVDGVVINPTAAVSNLAVTYPLPPKTIDPNFIPAMDSVTLNSPGGKQYKLTVSDSGAITATEV
jgi:hypothetical protein